MEGEPERRRRVATFVTRKAEDVFLEPPHPWLQCGELDGDDDQLSFKLGHLAKCQKEHDSTHGCQRDENFHDFLFSTCLSKE